MDATRHMLEASFLVLLPSFLPFILTQRRLAIHALRQDLSASVEALALLLCALQYYSAEWFERNLTIHKVRILVRD